MAKKKKKKDIEKLKVRDKHKKINGFLRRRYLYIYILSTFRCVYDLPDLLFIDSVVKTCGRAVRIPTKALCT